MAAPSHSHRGRAEGIFQNQIPADDPRDQFAQRRVRVRIRAARDRNHRSKLGVTQPRKSAGNAREDERDHNRGSGKLRRGLARDHKNARPDNCANAQREQIQRAQRAPQALFAFNFYGFLHQCGQVFFCEQICHLFGFSLGLSLGFRRTHLRCRVANFSTMHSKPESPATPQSAPAR